MNTRRVETLVRTGLECGSVVCITGTVRPREDLPGPLWVALHDKALDDRSSHKRSRREHEVSEQNNREVQMKLVGVAEDERTCNTEYDRNDEIWQLILWLAGATAFTNHHGDLSRECSTDKENDNCRQDVGQVAQASELKRNSVMKKKKGSV